MSIHAYRASLEIENPLSFRTNEYGNVVRTSRILHNFALRFALNSLRGDPSKDHLENLEGVDIYATPAVPEKVEYEFQTFHPFPEAPQLLKEPSELEASSRSEYQSRNTILHYKEFVRPGSTFTFAVASKKELAREMVITYAGKSRLQRVTLEEAEISKPTEHQGLIDYPVNPLDFQDQLKLEAAIKHPVPPSPLFEGVAVDPIRCRVIRHKVDRWIIPVSW